MLHTVLRSHTVIIHVSKIKPRWCHLSSAALSDVTRPGLRAHAKGQWLFSKKDYTHVRRKL